jgi:GNAT superfamily N-acetyltransferase
MNGMQGFRLRGAILADAPALAGLHVASWRETYTGILPDELLAGLSVDSRAAMWATILGDLTAVAEAAVYIAEDQERLVGFGSCGKQRHEGLAGSGYGGEFGALYVLQSHQHRGIGRSIMSLMAQALLERDCPGAALWVLSENLVARSFYERLGGAIVAEKEEMPDMARFEVAYGWSDLSALVDHDIM